MSLRSSRSIRLLGQLNWENEMEDLAVCMDRVAAEMKKLDRDVAISRVTGSSVAMAGGVMMAAGLIGSVFTFGTLAPLVVAGAVASAAGGLTSSGSQLTQHVILQHRVSKAKEKLESRASVFQKMKGILEELNSELDRVNLKQMANAKESAARIREIAVSIGSLLTTITEVTAALSEALVSAGAGAVAKAGMKSLGAAGTAVAVGTGMAIYDVITASDVLQNGGNSCNSFERIAKSIREIKRAMREEVTTLSS
ncbi:hypothetical protein KP509_1Z271700 [Ceratopteris richardii]|nr:hypothetical protein KP509_1Z271700 [Ceratopteris richardii]